MSMYHAVNSWALSEETEHTKVVKLDGLLAFGRKLRMAGTQVRRAERGDRQGIFNDVSGFSSVGDQKPAE